MLRLRGRRVVINTQRSELSLHSSDDRWIKILFLAGFLGTARILAMSIILRPTRLTETEYIDHIVRAHSQDTGVSLAGTMSGIARTPSVLCV